MALDQENPLLRQLQSQVDQTRPPQDVDVLAVLVRKFSDIVVLGRPRPVLFLIPEVFVLKRPQDQRGRKEYVLENFL